MIFLTLSCWTFFGGPVQAASVRSFVVVVPKAALHSKPSFSSSVVVTVPKGTLLRVSSRKVVGPDGVGVFYPVQSPSGAKGYISDVEIEPAPTPTKRKDSPQSPAPPVAAPSPVPMPVSRPNPSRPSALEPSASPTQDDAERGHIAFGLGLLNYAEIYRDRPYRADRVALFFARHSAQDFFGGMRSNFHIAFSPGPPKFLSSVGAEDDSGGYFVSLDYQLQKRFLKQGSFQIFMGLGVSVIHTQFHTSLLGVPYSSAATRPAGNLGIGALWSQKHWGLAFEARNYFEKTIYQNMQMSVLLY